MTRKIIRSVGRKLTDRAKLGMKLAYDTSPKPLHKSKAVALPGPLFDITVFSLGILGLVTYLWPS